jgi:hypothetical protein
LYVSLTVTATPFLDREPLEQLVQNEFEILPIEERLWKVLNYLRKQYSYCYFCGCQYENGKDLSEQCPGILEDDHESEQLC